MIVTPNNIDRWTVFLLTILISLIGSKTSSAREVIWVNAEGTAIVTSNNPNKARTQAIEIAKQNAVAAALASGITAETLLVNFRLSGSILGVIPYGKVVKKKIVDEGVIESENKNSSKQKRYQVRIKAGVVEQADEEASSFYLDASINQSVFKDGDELKIHIQSTKKCYFAVFNILEDNKIIPLLPNDVFKNNDLAANKTFIFPGEKERKKGFKIRVHLPESKTVVTESIYIIALLKPFTLTSNNARKDHQGMIDDQKALVDELIQKVMGIPAKNRAEALMPYEIRETSKKTSKLAIIKEDDKDGRIE
jgi:hypothetical protein